MVSKVVLYIQNKYKSITLLPTYLDPLEIITDCNKDDLHGVCVVPVPGHTHVTEALASYPNL